MAASTTLDPAKELKVYFRCSRSGSKRFTFLDSNDAAINISSYAFQVNIYDTPGGSQVLSLTVGSGLTVGGAGNNELTLAITAAQSAIAPGSYYWELYKSSTEKTYLSGVAIFHNGVFDGLTEDNSSFIIADDTAIVEITINESGGSGGGGTWGSITGTLSNQTDLINYIASLTNQYEIKEKTSSHTLDANDLADIVAGKKVLFLMNVPTANTFTVPANSTLAIPIGKEFSVIRTGSGQTTFVPAPGVNFSESGGLTDPGINAPVTFIQTTSLNEWELANGLSGGGTGDVVGPASSTDNAVALFNGTTGKLIKDSTLVPTAAGIAMINAADAAAQTALLNAFTTALKGLTPASGGGTINFLRADGSWAQPPGTGGSGGITNVTLVFNGGSAITHTNIPAGVQELANSPRHRARFTGTGFERVRLHAVLTTAALNGGVGFIQYSTDDATYTTIGTGSGTQTVSCTTSGRKTSDWISLPSGAKADVWFRMATTGGDGAEDPVFGLVFAEFTSTTS